MCYSRFRELGDERYGIKYDSLKKDMIPDIETLILRARQEI